MSHIEPCVPLDALDPDRTDPGYWSRFQARVMTSVGPELLRRRRARMTMSDVMVSWSRLVVPFTVVAAAGAGLVLLQPPQPEETETIAGLEEFLRMPLDGAEPLPAFLHTDEIVDRDVVLFVVEGY